LHISVLFLNSLNNESLATTEHSLITLPSSKGFFFLAKISVILYEAMVATLALLTGLENIA
jgi:predicted Abi (CAAX) family protease